MMHHLTGFDGTNPLGFMAALGALCVGEPHWTLRWELRGAWTPVLVGPVDEAALIDAVLRDRDAYRHAPALGLEYDLKTGPGTGKRNLKPTPEAFLSWWNDLPKGPYGRGLAASFGTPDIRDGSGHKTKPSALHFCAGQQQFLKIVHQLRDALDETYVRNALFGPWEPTPSLPTLAWDSSVRRDYALQASDPAGSSNPTTSVPAADWLAFRSWTLFPSFPANGRLRTVSCEGGWKTGSFRWPLWTDDLDSRTVGALLAVPPAATEHVARGIAAVLDSPIRRSDQGGYGSMAPASPVLGR